MIIVLTSEFDFENEANWINQLLENGLDLIHIRKFGMDEELLEQFILSIAPNFRNQLVLHSHHHLAKSHGIKRLHFNTENRLEKKHLNFSDDYKLSTSTHSIEEFNSLGSQWDYAFCSPVFLSISKQRYGLEKKVLNEFQFRKNHDVKLIGLGGINQNNASKIFQKGADGIALLGSIWQSENPLKSFISCREIVHSY